MIALWMLYAMLLGGAVSLVALLLERAVALWRAPRRGIWMAAIALSVVAPIGVILAPSAPSSTRQGESAVALSAVSVSPMLVEGSAVEGVVGLIETFMSAVGRGMAPLDRPLALLWGAASITVFLLLTRSALHLRRRRRGWALRMVDGREVLVADDLGPAALPGSRPGIVIPRWVLDMEAPARRLVLRHEEEHRAAGDPWLLLVALLAIVVAPWNLALWWQLGRLRLSVEVDCDHRVLGDDVTSPADVQRYGLLLITLGQRASGLLHMAAPALSEPVSTLERRIDAMTYRIPPRRWLRAAGLTAVAGALFAIACAAPAPDRAAGPEDQDALASVTPAAGEHTTYFEFQVEKPVTPLNNAQPDYPATLRDQGVTGRVIAQFVVDTTGMAELETFEVLQSDHGSFTDAVRAALPEMRFTPAEIGGRPVKQLVQQPFVFSMNR